MAFKKCNLTFREVEPSDLPRLRELRNTQAVGWRDNRGVQTLYQQEKWYLSLGHDSMAFIAMDGTLAPAREREMMAVGVLRLSQFDSCSNPAPSRGRMCSPSIAGKAMGLASCGQGSSMRFRI